MQKVQYKQDEQTLKDKAQKLLPLKNSLEQYRQELGDGTMKYRGLVTGFTEIDDLISGLDRFILLAGRSGAGKTTLATQLALGVAKHTPVLFYSLEMDKADITTMILQILAKGLYRNDIELRGNSPDLPKDIKAKLDDAFNQLSHIANNVYVKDATAGVPRIADAGDANSIFNTVEAIKAKHETERVLVVIDSVQDVIPTQNNQIQAEVETLQKLTEVQQKTGATILVIAQKNKGSINSQDSYGDVMGSMSFIHKPNTVIELVTPKELLAKSKDDKAKAKEVEQVLQTDAQDGKANPIFLNIIKGRHTGTKAVPLQYYGAYGYYDADNNNRLRARYSDVYNMFDK